MAWAIAEKKNIVSVHHNAKWKLLYNNIPISDICVAPSIFLLMLTSHLCNHTLKRNIISTGYWSSFLFYLGWITRIWDKSTALLIISYMLRNEGSFMSFNRVNLRTELRSGVCSLLSASNRLYSKRIRYGPNYQINSHGFTLTYAAMIVIRILTVCTNIVKKYLNSLSADMGENTTLKSFPASHWYHWQLKFRKFAKLGNGAILLCAINTKLTKLNAFLNCNTQRNLDTGNREIW